MRILATAKPNQMYENYRSIFDLVLQARLVNNKVYFYETHTKDANWVKCISVDLVKSLFENNRRIKERPFLKDENRSFYVVLNRHRTKYREQYIKLKNNRKYLYK